jgi:hypothetical protein
LPKIILGVRFADGMEVVRCKRRHYGDGRRLRPNRHFKHVRLPLAC